MIDEIVHRFAVVADAHFHDPPGWAGFPGFPSPRGGLALRFPGEIARSPRIYNEAGHALRATLTALAGQGIRDVVLLGDYSDDGQQATLGALEGLLSEFRRSHGMRFMAVPGNHDIFGDHGRHRRKRYAGPDGDAVVLSSDPGHVDPRGARSLWNAGMRCGGYPDNLPRQCGFFDDIGALHFETPFGSNPDPSARTYPLDDGGHGGSRRLMDASYLVEPVAGLWLVMIDANVFAPDPDGDDGLADSTAAGWNALVRRKPFVVDWLRDVDRRARAAGKQVIHFSHYPVLETLNGTLDLEIEMMGANGFHRRMPERAVGEILLEAGLRLHFSGHVHVNDTARLERDGAGLVNVAVPALVAFPAAVKIVSVEGGKAHIDTWSLDAVPLDPVIREASRHLCDMTGADAGRMFDGETHGSLVDAHLEHVTGRRFIKREWPEDLAPLLRAGSLADLARAAGIDAPMPDAVAGLSGLAFLADWYRLRAGGDLADDRIAPERRAAYRSLAGCVHRAGGDRRLQLLFRSLGLHLDGLPSRTVTVDLADGQLIG